MSEYPYDELSAEVPPDEPVATDPYVEEPVVAEPPPPPPVEPPPPPPVEPPPAPPVEEPPPPPVEQAPPPPPVEESPPPPPAEGPPPPPVEDPSAGQSVEQVAPDESPVRPGQPGFEDESADETAAADESPVRPGQPGFEDESADETAAADESPVRPGQPGFEDESADETAAADESPVRPGQPGFEGDGLPGDGLPGDGLPGDELAGEDLTDSQSPFPTGQPGFGELPEDGFVFEPTDMSCWCTTGLPEEWTEWTPPVEPSPESWTDEGYSTEWGVVEPEWAVGGEDPLTVTDPGHPLTGVLGPGHAADVHWADQGDTQYCGLYSVRSILSELYGKPVDMDEMVQRATANAWFVYENGEVKGIRPRDIDDILASYGVGSTQFGGPDTATVADRDAWNALNTALTNNQRVVVGVDGREFDQGRDVGTAAIDMDHFVAVTGVDYGRGVVIVNDSARSAGLEIPLDVFFNSWRDSNFSLTTTNTSMPGDGTAAPPVEGGPDPDAPGISIIGTTLTPEPGEPGEPGEISGPGEDPGTITGDPTGPAPLPQELGTDGEPGEAGEATKVITAEGPGDGSADPEARDLVGDGVARPTALLGDLSPGFGDADLSNVGKSLDLGMADGLLDSILPNGIGDSVAGDDGVFDAVIDLLGSIDDAIVDLAKGILSFTTDMGGIRT